MSGNQTRVGWQRIQVNLAAYVGREIRLRWVINALDATSGVADGWYLDDIRFFYNGSGAGQTAAIPIPFTVSDSVSPSRWIADGIWGLTFDWFNPVTEQINFGAQTLGNTTWRGHWANCSIVTATGQSCNAAGAFNALNQYWPMPAGGAPAALPALSTTAGTAASRSQFAANQQQPSNVIRIIANNAASDGPYGIMEGAYVGDITYRENVSGRFMRRVSFAPGTYVFQISHDDNFRVRLNDGTGTGTTGVPATIYDNSSWMNRNIIQTRYLTVTTAIDRILVVDYWGGGGGNHMFLNVARLGSSFSDSPNWNGVTSTYSTVNSLNPSKTSLMLNGFFNTSSVANPTLRFSWIAQQTTNTRLFVDVSTDGGFTWTSDTTSPASWNIANTRFPVDWNWQPEQVTLPQAATVMVRFRYNTAGNTSDGVYITDISVTSG
jgi:hypothetical protein